MGRSTSDKGVERLWVVQGSRKVMGRSTSDKE